MISPSEFSSIPKLAAVTVLAIPIYELIETYLYADWEFIRYFGVIVAIDMCLSLAKHWKNRSLSSNGFSKIFLKISAYAIFLVVAHSLANYRLDGVQEHYFAWMPGVAKTLMMIREASSILEHLGVMAPGLISKALLKRFEGFSNKTGEPEPKEPTA